MSERPISVARTPAADTAAPAVGVAVSVVVCGYTLDRWDDLVAAVTSLQQQSEPPAEIIVVSDHNPHLFERVGATWPHVVTLENQERPGLSGARNTAVLAASGGIVAFLDDDARADPEWLSCLQAAYDEESVLGVGGAILPAWDTGRPAWFPEEFDWVVGCTYKGMPQTRSRLRNLIGANMSFRRELFVEAGDFQTDMGRVGTLPVGCEETELCIRGTQKLPGKHYVYEPLARVQHRVPAGRATLRYFVSRCYSEGLSKAQVSDRVGATEGLASEKTYTTRILPKGVMLGLHDALTRRRPGGLARAGAIVVGLAITTIGYLRGRLAGLSKARTSTTATPPGSAADKAPAEAS